MRLVCPVEEFNASRHMGDEFTCGAAADPGAGERVPRLLKARIATARKYTPGGACPIRTARRSRHRCGRSTARPTVDAAELALKEFEQQYGQQYPGAVDVWRNAWPELVPFLHYPVELRKIVHCTDTNDRVDQLPITQDHQEPRPFPRQGRTGETDLPWAAQYFERRMRLLGRHRNLQLDCGVEHTRQAVPGPVTLC